jgi:hypothetical protein
MKFSKQSVEILLDLVEIKISAMHIHDREDARELMRLKSCREELLEEKNRRNKKVMIDDHSPVSLSKERLARRSFTKSSDDFIN